MEIYVIRHTQVDVPKGTCYGQTDVPVSDSFEKEFLELKQRLPMDFDAAYSSPLSRCMQLAKQFSKEIITDNRLKEMYFGDWELKLWNDIPLTDIQPWYDDFVTISTPNGESFQDLYARCSFFLDELRSQKHQKVLIVTHGGIIRSMWAYLLKVPLQNAFKIPVGFGELFHFHLGKNEKEDFIVEKK